jgi:14-3-3 protein epsilon
MVEYVKKFANLGTDLSSEERNIVSAAYKNVVGNKRAELRVLTAIE